MTPGQWEFLLTARSGACLTGVTGTIQDTTVTASCHIRQRGSLCPFALNLVCLWCEPLYRVVLAGGSMNVREQGLFVQL